MGDHVILDSGVVTPIECLHYAMTLPTSVVITGIERPEILDQAVEAVRTFQPMTATQIAALLQRTAPAAADGRYERFKTTTKCGGGSAVTQLPSGATVRRRSATPPPT
jgi:hypothetical protein